MAFSFGLRLGLIIGGACIGVQSASAQETLVIAGHGGKVDEVFKQAFIPFEKQHNVQIQWVSGTSTQNAAKVVATKGNPEFDIVMTDDINQAQLSSMGDVLLKLDPALMTNYDSLRPQAKFPGMDGIPVGFNLTGIFYNSEEFEANGWAAPASWNDLFRPEFCGRVGLHHPNVSYTPNMLISMAGGDLDKVPDAIAKVAELHDCIPTLEPSSAKMEEKIQLGEYAIGIHGSVRVLPLHVDGYPVSFVVPQEGSTLSSTTANATIGGNEELAMEFLNWFISPETQEILVRELFYIPSNQNVEIPEELAEIGMPSIAALESSIDPDRLGVMERRRDWARDLERSMSR